MIKPCSCHLNVHTPHLLLYILGPEQRAKTLVEISWGHGIMSMLFSKGFSKGNHASVQKRDCRKPEKTMPTCIRDS